MVWMKWISSIKKRNYCAVLSVKNSRKGTEIISNEFLRRNSLRTLLSWQCFFCVSTSYLPVHCSSQEIWSDAKSLPLLQHLFTKALPAAEPSQQNKFGLSANLLTISVT